jgi:prolyl-tRNA synthetase
MKKVYKNIFDKLWIWEKTFITLADWWNFTDKFSHEFQTILEIWEDEIFICKKCKTSHNKEIISEKFICANCKNEKYEIFKACEVWNIFPLETKFSKIFWMKILDKNNKEKDVIMWCYGIWISRLMWVIAEFFLKDDRILWPENIAPADYYFIILCKENQEKALEFANKLEKEWKEVIFDDRFGKKFWFWQKVFDAELYWVPNIVIFSDKTLEKWGYEMKKRWEEFKFFKV